MGDDEQDAMQALLGFSAFGGSSRAPKKRATGGASSSPYGVIGAVVQLMPGTALAWNRDEVLLESCRAGSDGVLLLTSHESDAVAALKAAMASRASVGDEAEDLLLQASRALLDQVQEQRQRCV